MKKNFKSTIEDFGLLILFKNQFVIEDFQNYGNAIFILPVDTEILY